LDKPANRSKLAAELKKSVRSGERIGLPAILGMDEHAAVFDDLESATGAPYSGGVPSLTSLMT
jgi:glycerol-3-phosphate dehydrogenase subunit B